MKWSVTAHVLLFVLLVAKLVPEVMDRMDIFVLELEELFVPKARGKYYSFETIFVTISISRPAVGRSFGW